MSKDDYRFWLGIALGTLGLIASIVEFLKHDKNELAGAFFILLILLVFAWFFYAVRSGSGVHYDTLKMTKVLTIKDPQGLLAEVDRVQLIRARWGNLQGVWWRSNIADGSISDYQVDGAQPDAVEKLGNSLSFYKRFTNPLSKGEKKSIRWSFLAHNSFPTSQEAFLHETIPGTRELVLEVNFPSARKCLSAEFHEEIAGDATRLVDGLERTEDGGKLVACVKSPKAGHTYRIDWRW